MRLENKLEMYIKKTVFKERNGLYEKPEKSFS
jgi:hypothetical protein